MLEGTTLKILMWGLGLCFVGFTTTIGLIVNLYIKINEINISLERRITYTKLTEIFKGVEDTLRELKDAIYGTIKDEGLLNLVRGNKAIIKGIMETCEKNHGQ